MKKIVTPSSNWIAPLYTLYKLKSLISVNKPFKELIQCKLYSIL
jgi:hypothetical protein